jgi:hypothetical protein
MIAAIYSKIEGAVNVGEVAVRALGSLEGLGLRQRSPGMLRALEQPSGPRYRQADSDRPGGLLAA